MSTLASLPESIMLKQSPSRNQRSKEFKVKHALQICLLLAICIWLLYQVKQTCRKSSALEESSRTAKLSYDNRILKLGRKGLIPQLEEIVTDIKTSANEDDDIGQEDKLGESNGDKTTDGDDEIDGQDQDKDEEEESEQLEDLIDEDDNEGKGSIEIDSDGEDVDLIK